MLLPLKIKINLLKHFSKYGYFSPKIGGRKKSCQNPFSAILRLKKKYKKKGKALMAWPLVEELFFAASLTYYDNININLDYRFSITSTI